MQIQVGRDTGKAFIFASTNPHYDDRLFIELRVQYMKIPISEHVVYMNCFECQNKKKPICVHNMLLACSELVDARIRASEKDLPVHSGPKCLPRVACL